MSDEIVTARLEELFAFRRKFPGVEVREYVAKRISELNLPIAQSPLEALIVEFKDMATWSDGQVDPYGNPFKWCAKKLEAILAERQAKGEQR